MYDTFILIDSVVSIRKNVGTLKVTRGWRNIIIMQWELHHLVPAVFKELSAWLPLLIVKKVLAKYIFYFICRPSRPSDTLQKVCEQKSSRQR